MSRYVISHQSQRPQHSAGTENSVIEADKARSALARYTVVCPKWDNLPSDSPRVKPWLLSVFGERREQAARLSEGLK